MKRLQRVKATKAEIAQALKERAYWKELAELVGWKVAGWTDMIVCDYKTKRHSGFLEIWASERDDLIWAIRTGKLRRIIEGEPTEKTDGRHTNGEKASTSRSKKSSNARALARTKGSRKRSQRKTAVRHA